MGNVSGGISPFRTNEGKIGEKLSEGSIRSTKVFIAQKKRDNLEGNPIKTRREERPIFTAVEMQTINVTPSPICPRQSPSSLETAYFALPLNKNCSVIMHRKVSKPPVSFIGKVKPPIE